MYTHGHKRDIYVYFEILKQYDGDLASVEDLIADYGNRDEDVEDKFFDIFA
jgi:phosphopentomutase